MFIADCRLSYASWWICSEDEPAVFQTCSHSTWFCWSSGTIFHFLCCAVPEKSICRYWVVTSSMSLLFLKLLLVPLLWPVCWLPTCMLCCASTTWASSCRTRWQSFPTVGYRGRSQETEIIFFATLGERQAESTGLSHLWNCRPRAVPMLRSMLYRHA